MQVGMDSYYYAFQFQDEAGFFGNGGGVPASPELPFGFGLIASPEPEPPLAEARRSAFREYRRGGGEEEEATPPGMRRGGSGRNIHRRVMDALGRMAAAGGEEGKKEEEEEQPPPRAGAAVESSRGFRHMMRERQRREKLSQSYADLYAMVSSRSKGDKNSIVQSAAIYIHELRGAREQLQRKNEELKARLLGHDARQQCVKIQFEVDEPSSSIDSMIGALRRLKSMNVKTRGIRSDLSSNKLSTVMNVETTVAASEVERAVEVALQEVERNQADTGSRGGWSQASHVQNVF